MNLSAKQLEAAARELCRIRKLDPDQQWDRMTKVWQVYTARILYIVQTENDLLSAIEHAKREVSDGE